MKKISTHRLQLFFWMIVTLIFIRPAVAVSEEYWPSESEWETMTPEAAKMDDLDLHLAAEFAEENNSRSLLILRHGKIVFEQYWGDHTAETRQSIASSTKSMTAMMIGMALEDGKFSSIDQPVSDFFQPWKENKKDQITLKHMLTMTSGLRAKGYPVSNVKKRDQFLLNAGMPLEAKPGTKWSYNTPAYHMLFRLIEKATGESMEAYGEKRLFGPLGMNNTEWVKNEVGEVTNYYRVKSTARDMARFGLFALRGGRWQDQQLVTQEFFGAATTPSQDLNRSYGYLWWVNSEKGLGPASGRNQKRHRFPGSPLDTIACLGAQGQNIYVIPSKDLVIVRQGKLANNARFPYELLSKIVGSLE